MANRYLLIRALALSALRQKTEENTPIDILEEIIIGKFTTEVANGKTLISTTEAGGSATFALMGSFGPDEIMSLVMETIVWINSQPDPEDYEPYPTRRIKRLRASFAKAMI